MTTEFSEARPLRKEISFRCSNNSEDVASRPRAAFRRGAARSTAMPARFALCESRHESVLANEGTSEIQGDGADVQMGDPNALQSVPQLDIISWYGEFYLYELIWATGSFP